MTEKARKQRLSAEDRKMCRSVYWRTMTLSSTWNYEMQQALGYVFAMIPVIRRFYTKKEDQIAALKRNNELFNTTPTMGGMITGLTASMEKENAENPDFDPASINAVKISLMGPFAGIGDSLFWGTLRVISLGIGISLAQAGNPIGALVHLLIYNIPAHILRYYGVFKGYELGSSFMKTLSESGLFGTITKCASIVGMTTVGAMACTMTEFKLTKEFSIAGQTMILQDVIDSICPTLLTLLLTFFCYKMLKKGKSPALLMVGILVFGVLLKLVGLV